MPDPTPLQDPDPALVQMGRVFDSAATDFSRLAPHLWDPIGVATVALAAPATGEWVLDVCSGDGASAIPAARSVGPSGRVHAVDLSPALVDVLNRRGAELGNLTAQVGDGSTWTPDPEPARGGYDLVQCVLGPFFFSDMTAGTEHLIGALRPGGRAAFTIWHKGSMVLLGDAAAAVVAAEKGVDPPRPREPHLIDRVDTAAPYRDWLTECGLRDVRVEVNELSLSLEPDLAWLLVTGSGFRGMLHGLDDAAIERVRVAYLEGLAARGATVVDATTLVGIGTVCEAGAPATGRPTTRRSGS